MKTYIIYTDGSDFKKTTRRLGVGGILIDPSEGGSYGKKIGEFSEELDRGKLELEYGASEASNPFAELFATYYALRNFSGVFKPGDRIIMRADYEGVQKWLTGKWRASTPYIKKLHTQIKQILDNSPWKVDFEWVKGHQLKSVLDPDAFWNNEVDKLAKGQ